MSDIYIAIDFDGTIVTHDFPRIGRPAPGAIEAMKEWQARGVKLLLNTMRSDGQEYGDVLSQAVEYLRENGIELYGVNHNPDQSSWTASPKVYAKIYIDDAAFGCPLLKDFHHFPVVDWSLIVDAVNEKLDEWLSSA